jgi:hypothetical protein
MEKTLKQLRDGGRQRADMAHDSDAVSDLEANQYVNEAYHELFDIITGADDAKLFAVNATKPPQVGDFSFRLPTDFYRLVSVHVRRDGRYVQATPADSAAYAELAANQANTSARYRYQYLVRWDINTGERFIFVFPAPSSDTLAITYWPQPKELSIDSDSLDNPASWLEFVMVAAGVRMLNKVERDATALLFAKRQLGKRIQKAVYATDFNFPRTIRGTSSRSAFGGLPGW